jgi:hypothetical protein
VSEIWRACAERAVPIELAGTIHRLVESQEQVATNALVKTLAEQALLEDLLEQSKPPLDGERLGLHYLLATPFRYPPLPWGSRFGSRFEPSLFYAARTVETVLAEGAFYRFVFWTGMATPPPAPLHTRHTVFAAEVRSARGLALQDAPFAAHESALTDPRDYGATQALGRALRAAGIEAFEYLSARDPRRGRNLALFTPRAFAATEPARLDEWLCDTDAATVTFYSRHGGGFREYPLGTFLVDGVLPAPPR